MQLNYRFVIFRVELRATSGTRVNLSRVLEAISNVNSDCTITFDKGETYINNIATRYQITTLQLLLLLLILEIVLFTSYLYLYT